MRRNQYSSEKRRKELDRKKKQEEKRQKKLDRRVMGPDGVMIDPPDLNQPILPNDAPLATGETPSDTTEPRPTN